MQYCNKSEQESMQSEIGLLYVVKKLFIPRLSIWLTFQVLTCCKFVLFFADYYFLFIRLGKFSIFFYLRDSEIKFIITFRKPSFSRRRVFFSTS